LYSATLNSKMTFQRPVMTKMFLLFLVRFP
jgi:hypothetical protein